MEFSFKSARLELFAGLREAAPVFAALLRRDKLQAVLSKFEAKCTLFSPKQAKAYGERTLKDELYIRTARARYTNKQRR